MAAQIGFKSRVVFFSSSWMLLANCGGFEADSAALSDRAKFFTQTRVFSAATAIDTGAASGSLSQNSNPGAGGGLGGGSGTTGGTGTGSTGGVGGSTGNGGADGFPGWGQNGQGRIPSNNPFIVNGSFPGQTPFWQLPGHVQADVKEQMLAASQQGLEGQIPVKFYCSTNHSQGRLVDATAVKVRIRALNSKADTSLCEVTNTALKSQLLASKKMDLDAIYTQLKNACPTLTDGKYHLDLLSDDALRAHNRATYSAAAKSPTNRGTNLFQHSRGQDVRIQNGKMSLAPGHGSPFVYLDFNPSHGVRVMPDVECNQTASPLVIQMNANVARPQRLELTSQLNGIVFDILGRNAQPAAHTPYRISWHRSLDYLFMTLPNASGQVNGIDELFGDNTFGPDGQFSTDGFHALAKWDGMSADGKTQVSNRDGKIDSNDPIYHRLRLWKDSNFDGVAQSIELLTMASVGVTSVDLMYDPHYYEKDVFGNEIRYKSIVKMKNGKMNLVFDLWFNHQEF